MHPRRPTCLAAVQRPPLEQLQAHKGRKQGGGGQRHVSIPVRACRRVAEWQANGCEGMGTARWGDAQQSAMLHIQQRHSWAPALALG